ncbi:ArsR/SmtB family transcription factor [Amycolatopsis taiwanensis]|uniref:Transcriptional regulator n=1 Tax=Amycolatopsis taiwanensis TaxID=342230 RepID=A0A9W6QTB8_9PSEU|nr:winged helix-turn-helix domain-containing protein [Amycolatopsis taiwanensis]GLY63844.1 transcriptional regulator [Amycolatopsis taiwanensis]
MSRLPYSIPDIAAMGRLLGDQSRVAMVVAMMDGRAWTVGELARHVGIAKATATEHAHLLVDGGLCEEARQGRHRYLRLASSEVADAAEALGTLSAKHLAHAATLTASTRDAALRRGRTCYRHLAGALGVAIADDLRRLGIITEHWDLGPTGADWFAALGVDPAASRRPQIRPCLDWTERRDHLAGSLADGLCQQFLDTDWIQRRQATRAVDLTDTGREALRELGLNQAASLS